MLVEYQQENTLCSGTELVHRPGHIKLQETFQYLQTPDLSDQVHLTKIFFSTAPIMQVLIGIHGNWAFSHSTKIETENHCFKSSWKGYNLFPYQGNIWSHKSTRTHIYKADDRGKYFYILRRQLSKKLTSSMQFDPWRLQAESQVIVPLNSKRGNYCNFQRQLSPISP